MKKKSISLIIWLMSIALLGVMAMQYYFIRETYFQESQLFDEKVNTSLSKVASEIEKSEVLDFAKIQSKVNRDKYIAEQKKQQKLAQQLGIQEEIDRLRLKQQSNFLKFKEADEELKSRYPNVTPIENWFYETYYKIKPNRKFIQIRLEQEPILGTTLANTYVIVSASRQVPKVAAKDDSVRYVISEFDLLTGLVNWYQIATLPPKEDVKINRRISDLVGQLDRIRENLLAESNPTTLFDSVAILSGKKASVVEDVAMSVQLANRPLHKRINTRRIQQLIQQELSSRDIHSPFNMEIRDHFKLIYETSDPSTLLEPQKLTRYTTDLFKGDIGESRGRLSIYFPNKKNIIAKNISYLFLPTIALFALLVGCFAYTLSIIFKQKKISEMKTDFINNMTHEFKTPVATIMIASESLRDPEISDDKKRVNRLANIIYDENVRLGNHIERVLNIAKLEKEDLKIEKTDVHLNNIVEDVVDSMYLRIDKVNGKLTKELYAEKDLVIGDELHLSNVMFNLVDNAIKYSLESPDITVKTYNSNNKIIISVSDKGMGMTKDQQEKIFDQFYRIPTGNVHNVKGFGLGLSYVSDIIKRFDGKITVKSEKDKGTTFEVILPLKSK
ncbi:MULTISPECIES: sensor histidine kinase [Sphingobacterium]|uniref:histidine kinase n=1 Tax=Sphingobacterium litopenaei TaxID=2763500 RepID=A0ABR7YGE1_9SPHI|nr:MULTISPECIES: HAMP domain-containing sensor histidine kinase [Sphingobacterium]MBD1430355.1 HAMP domain-containing histidine kinase [Sphingobacterium litopenaei]NGM73917.1 HAMP domain-containing histidine kinase [Sphingobacterium sp. SGL-16]